MLPRPAVPSCSVHACSVRPRPARRCAAAAAARRLCRPHRDRDRSSRRYRVRAGWYIILHTAMALDQVLVEFSGAAGGDLATVILNRPERRNSLSESMLRDLGAALQRATEPPG